MRYLFTLFVALHLLVTATADTGNCQKITKKREKSVTFECTGLTSLMSLDAATSKTTTIEITSSKISHIVGFSFARFGASLVTLDMHESGIETIDDFVFVGLTKLENLILWGNKLRTVPSNWFLSMSNLRTLDLSFNFIEVIDYGVFPLLPNLENFYFDYNRIKFIDYSMFSYLRSLKNVKFEKNPLQWGFRALLTWQLENKRAKYTEEWESWKWMNVVIKGCTESGYGEIPHDTVLDCIVEKLLDFTHEIFSTEPKQQIVSCNNKARELVRCMRPKNATGNTNNETVRRILEDYATILTPMFRSQGRFSIANNN